MISSSATQLDQVFIHLAGKACWGIASGRGTGSQATLHFGKKADRARVIDNPHLSADLRRYEGEFILFVQCDWKIDHKDRLESSSSDSHAAMDRGLARLRGKTIQSCYLSPEHRLFLLFNGDFSLALLPRSSQSYSLFTPDWIAAVKGEHQIKITDRKAEELDASPRQRAIA